MTSHKSRPITPELRDIPLTWRDCDLATIRTDFNNKEWDGCKDVCGSCELIRDLGKCPRGYPS